MALLVSCPRCGESENMDGRNEDGNIIVVCGECALEWERDLRPRCPRCGETDVRPAFEAVVEKSRGTQLSMQSARLIHLCPVCDAVKLADYHRTSSPIMPRELPTATGGSAVGQEPGGNDF
jgi:5-methylcytosine-specific restriction endonuclease McrA